MLSDAQQAVLAALDELNLIGELRDDSHRLDPVVVEQFFARKSVKRICSYAMSLLAQGHDRKQVASLVCQEYGTFLEDACLAATRPTILDDDDLTVYERIMARSDRTRTFQRSPVELEEDTLRIFRVPIEWINASLHRDVELYLEYLQSLIRSGVQEYINDIAEAIGKPRCCTIKSLLNFLRKNTCRKKGVCNEKSRCRKKSHCILYYPQLKKLFLSESEYQSYLKKHGRRSMLTIRNSKGEERYLADTDLSALLGIYLSGPTLGAGYKGCFGFIYGDISDDNLFESDVEVFVMRDYACLSCDACIVVFALSRLICGLCEQLIFWNPAEVANLVLRNEPLPKFIGFVEISNPGWAVVSDQVESYVKDKDTGGIRDIGTSIHADAFFPCSGYTFLKFLPCIPPEAVVEVCRRVYPHIPREHRQRARYIGAKHFALYHHALHTISSVSIHNPIVPEIVVDTLPMSHKTVRELTSYWNLIAPPEWRFGGQNPAKNFFKALNKACNAIIGQNLRSSKTGSKREIGYTRASRTIRIEPSR